MNIYKKALMIAVFAISTFKVQAYTFTVNNLTNEQHTVAIQLKGPGQKPSDAQTIEPLNPANPGIWQSFKNAVSGVVDTLTQFQQELSNSFNKITADLNSSTIDSNTLTRTLDNLKADIESKARLGALKVGAKPWVYELAKIQEDIKKTGRTALSTVEKQNIATKLTNLQSKITDELAKPAHNTDVKLAANTVQFQFGGLRAGLCVSKILIDGNPCSIYSINAKHYDLYKDHAINNNTQAFKGAISSGHIEDLTDALFGVCFSRTFELIKLDNKYAVITKNIQLGL
jgi:hypothetical protein